MSKATQALIVRAIKIVRVMPSISATQRKLCDQVAASFALLFWNEPGFDVAMFNLRALQHTNHTGVDARVCPTCQTEDRANKISNELAWGGSDEIQSQSRA